VSIEEYEREKQLFSWEELTTLQRWRLMNKTSCSIEEKWAFYVLSANCLLKPIEGVLSDQEVLDTIMPYVRGIPMVYNTASTNFLYEPTQPIFTQKILPDNVDDEIDYAFLFDLENKNTKIFLSKLQLAYLISKNRSWYATRKSDVGTLKPCTKQNYYVAFNALSDYIREPKSKLNLNDIIKYRAWYCKGTGPKDLMFYGWVCGFATQLFRLSLLIPNVDVVERYGHSVWYVQYYSEYVFWDDAALYQNQKKLILKNELDVPIYFKTIDMESSTYLVAIVPKKVASYVEIKKEQVSNLKWQLTKTIKTPAGKSHLAENMVTGYTRRVYTTR
jgi:hypothetical protein